MAPLTCELWQVWCSLIFSDLWSHHCEGSKKNSCHSWPAGTAEKLPSKSCSLINRSYDEALHLAQNVSNRSIWFQRYQVNIFQQTNHQKKPIDRHTQRGTTQTKLTIVMISECHLCSYLVHSGKKKKKKCSVVQKSLIGKVELQVHTEDM
jgi:hypothetical protein